MTAYLSSFRIFPSLKNFNSFCFKSPSNSIKKKYEASKEPNPRPNRETNLSQSNDLDNRVAYVKPMGPLLDFRQETHETDDNLPTKTGTETKYGHTKSHIEINNDPGFQYLVYL